MKILINALAIQDSGGITVLEKVLQECKSDNDYNFLIICNDNENIEKLFKKYKDIANFQFRLVESRSFLRRLYYENVVFKKIVLSENIELIYNFSGTSQAFLKVPQLVKVHNLLFYTKKLDKVYLKNNKLVLWLKQIYLKRIVFRYMVSRSKFLEVQSLHVKKYMSDFIDTDDKTFFLKSDIDVNENEFSLPKKYDFSKKIKFLYIVGPHFEYLHKNFRDFTNAMLELKKIDIDFEINITLSYEQLNSSALWDETLNDKTNFIGYVSESKEMDKLFCDNTLLISTSIIETLGLHVIEAIKKGVIPIVPDEKYSRSVYGSHILTYKLFDTKSLLNMIFSIIKGEINCEKNIMILQNDLKINENSKYKNIVKIFDNIK